MSKADELIARIGMLLDEKAKANAAFDERIDKLKAQLEVTMKLLDIPNVEGNGATAYWRKSTTAEVEDWSGVMAYVQKHQAYDIIQRRIAPAAVTARFKACEIIPGITLNKTETFIVAKKGKKDEAEDGSK